MSQRDRRICLFASACLILSLLEYIMPKPLPFLKLGLANIPLLLALPLFSLREYGTLVLLKVVGSALISGTLFSPLFLITALGGISSGLSMKSVKSLLGERISLLGVSVIGSLVMNLCQIFLADALIYGPSVLVASPLILSMGLAGGIATGLLASLCEEKGILVGIEVPEESPSSPPDSPHAPFFALLPVVVALFFTESLLPLTLCLLFLLLAQAAAGRRVRLAPSLLLLFSFLFFSLFDGEGEVLWSWKFLTLTKSGLIDALRKALRLLSLVSASQTMVRYSPTLPGRFFSLLRETLGFFSSYRLSTEGGELTRRIRKTLESVFRAEESRKEGKGHPHFSAFFALCALFTLLPQVTTRLFSSIT